MSSLPNLYPDLGPAIDAAYERHNPSQEHYQPEIIKVIEEGIEEARFNKIPVPETVAQWAQEEIGEISGTGALAHWSRYSDELGQKIPKNLEELLRDTPNMSGQLEKLFRARADLLASEEQTLDGQNIGEVMHLVLVPLRAFRDNLEDLQSWLREMRIATNLPPDVISPKYYESMVHNQQIYNSPAFYHRKSPSEKMHRFSMRDYLNLPTAIGA
jgi:hypothetical protein